MSRKLNIKQTARLRNEHHLVLTDGKTGKIKQEAWAYNIILNAGLAQFVTTLSAAQSSSTWVQYNLIFGTNTTHGWCGQTFIGTGTGESVPELTAMLNHLSRRTNNQHANSMDLAQLTASNTRIAQWQPGEIQNTNITEVGLGKALDAGLHTHAMIEDSLGNPVIIEKGEFDVLTVYSKVIIQLSHGYGDQIKFVEGTPNWLSNAHPGNALLHMIYDTTGLRFSAFHALWVTGRDDMPPIGSDAAVKDPAYSLLLSNAELIAAGSFDTANHRLIIAGRVTAPDSNEGLYEVGLVINWASGYADLRRSVFRIALPCPLIWEGFDIEEEYIASGDGATTIFNTNWAPIVNGTETIRVDGAAVAAADYSIDYNTGQITFNTAPGAGLDIEADYSVIFIPKDENHVLDLTATFNFSCGNTA